MTQTQRWTLNIYSLTRNHKENTAKSIQYHLCSNLTKNNISKLDNEIDSLLDDWAGFLKLSMSTKT